MQRNNYLFIYWWNRGISGSSTINPPDILPPPSYQECMNQDTMPLRHWPRFTLPAIMIERNPQELQEPLEINMPSIIQTVDPGPRTPPPSPPRAPQPPLPDLPSPPSSPPSWSPPPSPLSSKFQVQIFNNPYDTKDDNDEAPAKEQDLPPPPYPAPVTLPTSSGPSVPTAVMVTEL